MKKLFHRTEVVANIEKIIAISVMFMQLPVAAQESLEEMENQYSLICNSPYANKQACDSMRQSINMIRSMKRSEDSSGARASLKSSEKYNQPISNSSATVGQAAPSEAVEKILLEGYVRQEHCLMHPNVSCEKQISAVENLLRTIYQTSPSAKVGYEDLKLKYPNYDGQIRAKLPPMPTPTPTAKTSYDNKPYSLNQDGSTQYGGGSTRSIGNGNRGASGNKQNGGAGEPVDENGRPCINIADTGTVRTDLMCKGCKAYVISNSCDAKFNVTVRYDKSGDAFYSLRPGGSIKISNFDGNIVGYKIHPN